MTLCCLPGYRRIVEELIEALMASRLYERSRSIELAVLGGPDEQAAIDEMIRPFDRFRVGYRSDDMGEYEFPALGLLQDACRQELGPVFYLHTKGVSRHPGDRHASAWRQLMLDVVVTDHQACLDALGRHDAVGTNWRGNHFSGNFWWARAEHIRRLPDVRALRHAPRMITRDPAWNVRLQCEFWLTMAAGRFHNIGAQYLDLYQTIRWSRDAASVIQWLLDSVAGSRYLEIVSGDPSPYRDRIDAATRDMIILAPEADVRATLPTTTDHADAYDVVFIDSWHDPEQCLEVIEWSLRRLGPFGAIVVHDTDPPTAWHGRPSAEYEPGTEWNGPVWQAIVRFRQAHPEIDVQTVDTDWGCTVIRPWLPRRGRIGGDPVPLDWASFANDRASLLNLVSVSRFHRQLSAVPFVTGRAPISSRTELINALIAESGFERYLEVGVGDGRNFEAIIASVRQGVDPDGDPTFRMRSDEFFSGQFGCPTYDLIFIDALHEEAGCLRDIEHALARLAPGGCIVVHDTNPPTAWHQRPFAEFTPGSAWNGTVWKAIVRFRERHPDVSVVTLDVDWGCTVIRRGPAPRPLAWTPAQLSFPVLDEHRHELLNIAPPTWASIAEPGDRAS